MNFKLVPERYREVAAYLKSAAPAFGGSPEYALHKGDIDDLPGVILAAFGSFLARISHEAPPPPMLQQGLDAVGAMLGRNDPQTTTAIHDEFFEALDMDPNAADRMAPLMGQELRRSYQAWRGSA